MPICLTVGRVPFRSGILASDIQGIFVNVVTVIHRCLLARHADGDVLGHNVTASLLKTLAASRLRLWRTYVRCTADQRSSSRIELLGNCTPEVLHGDILDGQVGLSKGD